MFVQLVSLGSLGETLLRLESFVFVATAGRISTQYDTFSSQYAQLLHCSSSQSDTAQPTTRKTDEAERGTVSGECMESR